MLTPTKRRRVAVTWFASADERQQIAKAVPDDVELVTPEGHAPLMSRFECSPEQVSQMVRGAEAVIGWVPIPSESLQNARQLRFLAWLHAGCDQLDLPTLDQMGVRVANVTGANGTVVAEHGLAFMLALAKRLRENDRNLRDGNWTQWWDKSTISISMRGSSVCIVGYGNVGRPLAQMCAALGMRVTALRRTPGPVAAKPDGIFVGGIENYPKVLEESDFVVLAIPLTRQTRGFLDAEKLSLLKRGCFVINVARGQIAREEDLYRALTSDRLGGYASDVWWDYADSMPPSYHFAVPSRLGVHRLPNVIGSGDRAANLVDIKDEMIRLGLESLAAYLRNQPIPRLVDAAKGY